jgi:hypothetical protein
MNDYERIVFFIFFRMLVYPVIRPKPDRSSWSHHVLSTSDLKTWTNISIAVPPVTGVHAVWLRFSVKGENGYKVDWFRFE